MVTSEQEWTDAFAVTRDPGTVGYDLESLFSAAAWQIMTMVPECDWRERCLAHLLEGRAEIMQTATVHEPSGHADPLECDDCEEGT